MRERWRHRAKDTSIYVQKDGDTEKEINSYMPRKMETHEKEIDTYIPRKLETQMQSIIDDMTA